MATAFTNSQRPENFKQFSFFPILLLPIYAVIRNYEKQTFFQQHNERYRSVNFGEELIKEMIMCRSAAITIIYYFQSMYNQPV